MPQMGCEILTSTLKIQTQEPPLLGRRVKIFPSLKYKKCHRADKKGILEIIPRGEGSTLQGLSGRRSLLAEKSMNRAFRARFAF